MFKMFSVKGAAEFAVKNRWFVCCIVFAVYLVILSVMDLKRRKLKLSVLLAGGIFIPAGVLCGSGVPPAFLAAGGAVGAVFLGISKITEESFGYGDSILIIIMGGFIGFWDILVLLMAAFMMAAVLSLILLIRGRFRRKDSFPFVPFLTVAYIGGMTIGIY